MLSIPIVLLLFLMGSPLEAEPERADLPPLIAEAQQAQERGDFQAAAKAYLRCTALRPDSAELWSNLGFMQHQIGAHHQAMASFRKALAIKPMLFVPNLFLGIDLLAEQRYDEAILHLSKAEKLNPSDELAALNMGRAYEALHRPLPSMEAYSRAILRNQKDPHAWFGLGVMSLEQVESDARLLTEQHANSSYVHALAAESFPNENKPLEASGSLDEAISAAETPRCLLSEHALRLFRERKPKEAEVFLERELHGKAACPIAILGEIYLEFERGQDATASRLLTNLSNTNKELLQSNQKRLPAEFTQEKLSFLDKESSALSLIPVRRPHLCSRAETPMTTLDLSDNRDPEFQLACSFYSGDYWTAALQARTLQSPARLYWEIRAYQQLAIAALNQAAIYAADSPEIHVLIGDIYRQRQHIEEAQSEYNRALALNPQDRGALLGLALVWYMTRHYNEALSAGQKLLEVSPQDPRLNLLVGETLVGLYRYKDAIDYLERSRSANREFLPRVHALLGRCYAAEENETQAIREFTLALAEDEDGSIHYQLARLYRKHGDLERSTALFAESKRLQQLRLQRASLAFKETEQSPPMEER